jgi:hypothetical protein
MSLIAIASLIGFMSTSGIKAGGGTVFDSVTKAPIAGAIVTLACRKDGLLHGSPVISRVGKTTDSDGRFFFDKSDMRGCDHVPVRASKEGYVPTSSLDVRYSYADYQTIPSSVYLTRVEDARMQQLRYHEAMSYGTWSDTSTRYLSIYGGFITALNIAKTPPELQLVRETFCAKLEADNRKLSPVDRSNMSKMMAGSPTTPIDHQKFVLPFCQKTSIPP